MKHPSCYGKDTLKEILSQRDQLKILGVQDKVTYVYVHMRTTMFIVSGGMSHQLPPATVTGTYVHIFVYINEVIFDCS